MSNVLRCAHGHEWEAAPGPAVCPCCGASAVPPSTVIYAPGPGAHATVDEPGPPRTTPETPPPGKADGPPLPRVPGYEVLGLLGRGGMGVVYRARQVGLNRLVALKMIRSGEHADPAALARFRTEAEVVARLQHPHVVQIHDIGEHDGLPYFSLEFCAGGSLDRQLAGTPQPARPAAELVETLARAVQAAHARGIVHRDLKPANVLLAADGTPKIADFGLAKHLGRDSGQTYAGAVLGTPSYMAPEQAAGRTQDIGPAADVYALGAILYQLLTGRPPFQGADVAETLEQVRSREPVPPGQLQPRTPRDLETVCLKCLEKPPPRRYASAAALADDLRRFLDGRPTAARPVGPAGRLLRWYRRNPAVAGLLTAVVAVLLLSTAVAWYLEAGAVRERDRADRKSAEATDNADRARESAAESRRTAEQLYVANGLRLADAGELFGALAWFAKPLDAGDGPAEGEDLHRLRLACYLRFPARPVPRHLFAHPHGVNHAAFSPDGRLVVTCGEEGTARVWDVSTGRPGYPPLEQPFPVLHAAFSPDGRRLVTASGILATPGIRPGQRTGQAQVWDAATGRPVGDPLPHLKAVHRAAFSPDGRLVVTAGEDSVARVWDAATGRPVGPPLKQNGAVVCAAFSPDGRLIVTAGMEYAARLWHADTGLPAGPPLQHRNVIWGASFSPDGRRLATASEDKTAQVWDVTTGHPVGPPLTHQGRVNDVAFSPDGRRVATAAYDDSARVWDAATGLPLTSPLPHPAVVQWVAFRPDGRLLATAGNAPFAQLWDVETGRPVGPPLRHQRNLTAVAFSPDGRRLVTASDDRTARVWDLAPRPPAVPVLPLPGDFRHAAFSPDGRLVVTACGDWQKPGEARLWDAATGRPAGPPLKQPGAVNDAAFSPDGRLLLTGAADGTAQLWDVAAGRPAGPPLHHPRPVRRVAFRPDGRLLATADEDRAVWLWDPETCRPAGPTLRHDGAVNDLAFSPDGRRLLTGCGDYGTPGQAQQWDVATGRPVGPPLRLQGEVRRVAYSPDGRRFVACGFDQTARVCDAATGRPAGPPLTHSAPVNEAAFSPDGRLVVTASADGTARLWEAATGRSAGPTLAHRSPVLAAAFSPDGRLVATAGQDRTARVWAAATGQPVTPPLPHDNVVLRVAFRPDGRLLLSGGWDNAVRLWDLRPDDRPAADLVRLTQALYGHRLDRFGALVPLPPDELRAELEALRAAYPADFAVPPR